MRADEFVFERRSNTAMNIKLPVSTQIQQIIQKNGGTIDQYWIHCSPVDHVGFFGGGEEYTTVYGDKRINRPMQATVIPSEPFKGQAFKYQHVERGYANQGKYKTETDKNGLWLSPLKPYLPYVDQGSLPFMNKYVFLVRLNDDAWVQPVNTLNKVRANLIGLKPPAGKHKVGQYNPSSKIAVIFEPAFKVVGKWTQQEINNQARRNSVTPEYRKQDALSRKQREQEQRAAELKKLDDLF